MNLLPQLPAWCKVFVDKSLREDLRSVRIVFVQIEPSRMFPVDSFLKAWNVTCYTLSFDHNESFSCCWCLFSFSFFFNHLYLFVCRRLFDVFFFFLYFFNIFLGLFSCLERILTGAILGVMFLGRTQKSVLSRDFELMDPGFCRNVLIYSKNI